MTWVHKSIFVIFVLLSLSLCAEAEELKFGILHTEDTLPIVVAENHGIFEKYGLKVKVIPFNSALERDAALMANELDAVITDPLAVIILRNKGYDIKIVSICLGEKPDEGVFSILSSPHSNINCIKDLKGKRIAISSNTIIEYVTDMLLKKYNIKAEKTEVRRMPLRLQMLLSDKVDAATLPEPLATYAVSRGAKEIVSDVMLKESITQTVIVFTNSFIENHKTNVEDFLKAYKESVSKINASPYTFKKCFLEVARIPGSMTSSYKVPHYPYPKRFPLKYYKNYEQWALKKGIIKKEMPYRKAIYAPGNKP